MVVNSVGVFVRDDIARAGGSRGHAGVFHTAKTVGGVARHGGLAKEANQNGEEGEYLHDWMALVVVLVIGVVVVVRCLCVPLLFGFVRT